MSNTPVPLSSDDKTPTAQHPCPHCGSEQVIIDGIVHVPPPDADATIWTTVLASKCVHAIDWDWCSSGGILTIRVQSPPTQREL